MAWNGRRILFVSGLLAFAAVTAPAALHAQAAPGPIRRIPDSQSSDSQPAAPVKNYPPQKRENLIGSWKINADASDNAHEKIAEAHGKLNGGSGGSTASKPSSGGGNSPNPSSGPYPGNGPGGNGGGNGPYGHPGGGQPYPGGSPGGGPGGTGPGGANNPNNPSGRGSRPFSSQPTLQDREQMRDLIEPATSLTLTQKEAEVDVTDEQGRKRVYFTDGRTPQRPQPPAGDENYVEAAARWDGARLVSDETGPHGGKITHTYELTPSGKQLIETISLDSSHMGLVIIRYVFDAAPSSTSTAAAAAKYSSALQTRTSSRPLAAV